MSENEEIIFEQKADQTIIFLVCAAGIAGGFFFAYKGLASSTTNFDLLGGAAVLFGSSAFLFFIGTMKRYLRLRDKELVFERKNLFTKFFMKIRYSDILRVERTEYLGCLVVKSNDGRHIKIYQDANQIAGSPLTALDRVLLESNPTVRKMEALREEIQNRIKRQG